MQELTADRRCPPAPALPARAPLAPREAAMGWLGLALLLAFQYGLFRQYAEREITWCYPRYHDQTGYLGYSYDCYEQILSRGLWPGLRYGFRIARQTPNGQLFTLEGSLAFLVLGPSRLSALTVNFVYFAFFQIVLALTLRWYTGRWSPVFLGVGLLLTATTPFYFAGGLMDYRIDFSAFCLFGALLCVIVRSGLLQSWRWALAAGAVAAWLVLQRHLTAVYVAGIGAGGLGWLCVAWLISAWNPDGRRLILRRLRGLSVAGAVLAAVAVPVLWGKWPVIRAYYIGHIDGSDNVLVGRIYGAQTALERSGFYFKSLALDHAGATFLALSAALLAAALGLGLLGLRLRRAEPAPDWRPNAGSVAFATLCLAAPFCALTLYGSPSPVVGGVMTAPLLLLVLTLAFFLLRVRGTAWDATTRRGVAAFAALSLGVGCYVQANALAGRVGLPPERRANFEQVSLLYDRIADYCRLTGCNTPRIACNSMSDYHTVLQPVVYERKGVLLAPLPQLAGTAAVPEAAAVEAVRHSDIVVMAVSEEGEALYPFQKSMREARSRMLAACQEEHVAVQRFHLPGEEVELYLRPKVGVEGATPDHWITPAGLTLSATRAFLVAQPRMALRGSAELVSRLNRVPSVQAQLVAPDRTPRPLSADLTVRGREYQIIVDVKPEDLPDATDVQIQLSFDGYFVPAAHPEVFGPSCDQRRLVLQAPDKVFLQAPP
jgi:hypothetical protein